MNVFVIDASVAAKWALPPRDETFADRAVELLSRYRDNQVRFIVPDLFGVEFANVLWKAARRGRITRVAAHEALSATQSHTFPTVPSLTLLEEALTIAGTFDRSVYDSLYVALAVAAKAQFVTADEKLAHALAAHLPVKLLGMV